MRRSYIRRKHCLQECTKFIHSTVVFLCQSGCLPFSDAEISSYSARRAEEVEAACWSPRLKMSDQEYQNMALGKARELTNALCHQFGLRDLPHTPSVVGFEPHPPFAIGYPPPGIQMLVAPSVIPVQPVMKPVMVPQRVFIALHPPRTPTPIDGLGGNEAASGQEEEFPLDWNQPIREFDTLVPYHIK
jgi:hypothetical protein